MALRTILKIGDPRLLRRARPVTDFDSARLHELVADLHDTLDAVQGAGLAAPQIGVDLQVLVLGADWRGHADLPLGALINPALTPIGDEIDKEWEGCLSVPGRRGMVARHTRLGYRGLDQFGHAIEREVSGPMARLVQHECDHLRGILYPMRMADFGRFGLALSCLMDASRDSPRH